MCTAMADGIIYMSELHHDRTDASLRALFEISNTDLADRSAEFIRNPTKAESGVGTNS